MASAKKSVFKKVLIIILAVLTVHCAGSMIATKLIYDSIFSRYSAEVTEPVPELRHTVDNRECFFYDYEELTLAGYLYRCQSDAARDTLVVLAPGFHAGADNYLWQTKALLDRGWSVFSFDPSGSCRSSGDSYVGFPQEILDLNATLEFIEENGRFGYQNIALLGHSRGGYAAGCVLSYGHDVDAVVTVSGVNSAMEGIMGYSASAIGPLAYGNYGFCGCIKPCFLAWKPQISAPTGRSWTAAFLHWWFTALPMRIFPWIKIRSSPTGSSSVHRLWSI